LTVDRFVDPCRRYRVWCRHAKHPSGHIEQLQSGSWRAKVYAGKDPLTGREIRFRKTCKSELAAQIELGKLLALAQARRLRGPGGEGVGDAQPGTRS
jgi:hypothetical protein